MNQNDFRKELENLIAYRETRLRIANTVLANPKLYPYLLEVCYEFENNVSSRACWILEFVCAEKLEWLLPHIDDFINNLGKFKQESAIRPIAKITEMLTASYFGRKPSEIKERLNDEILEKIAEASYDWLISDIKVAPKAYAIRSLYLLGKQFKWIHPALIITLEQDYSKQSAGYKSIAKKILKKLKK